MNKFRKKSCIIALICLVLVSSIGFAGCKKDETKPDESDKKTTASQVRTSQKKTTVATGTTTGTTAKDSTSPSTDEGDDSEPGYVEPGDDSEQPGGDDNNSETNGDFPEERSFDFGGRLVHIAQEVALAGDWVLNPNNPLSVQEFASVDDVEAKYNCKINVSRLTGKQVNEGVTNAALAGIKFADVIRRWSYNALPGYVNQNIIYPLDEYIDGKGFEERYKGIDWNNGFSFWQGKRYGLLVADPHNLGTALVFNNTILDNEGLEYPYRHYWEGTWNWDLFLDYAIKTTKDFNGDGINDQWGVMNNPAISLFYSNGGNIVTFDENYNPIYGFDIVPNVRAMNFVIELINTYKVVDTSSGLKFQNGNHAFLFGGANQFSLRSAGFEDFGIVGVPKGPDVDTYISAVDNQAAIFFTTSIEEKDIEDIIQIVVDYLSVDEYEPYVVPFEEQRQQSREVRVGPDKEESHRIYDDLKLREVAVYTRYFSPLLSRTNAAIINPVTSLQTPLMTAVDAFRNEAMSIINSYYTD